MTTSIVVVAELLQQMLMFTHFDSIRNIITCSITAAVNVQVTLAPSVVVVAAVILQQNSFSLTAASVLEAPAVLQL